MKLGDLTLNGQHTSANDAPHRILWYDKKLSIALCVLTHTMCCLCFLRVRWFSWARIKKEISSVYERMTSSVGDHGWQGQVQDNHPKGLHAWSLWMITWWTSEDEYKAKLPTLCMGERLENFTNVLPSSWAKKRHQHQAQVNGSCQRY